MAGGYHNVQYSPRNSPSLDQLPNPSGLKWRPRLQLLFVCLFHFPLLFTELAPHVHLLFPSPRCTYMYLCMHIHPSGIMYWTCLLNKSLTWSPDIDLYSFLLSKNPNPSQLSSPTSSKAFLNHLLFCTTCYWMWKNYLHWIHKVDVILLSKWDYISLGTNCITAYPIKKHERRVSGYQCPGLGLVLYSRIPSVKCLIYTISF